MCARFWQNLTKTLYYKRTEQTNLNKSYFFALCAQVIDNFFDRVTERTHANNNTRCTRITIVIKKTVVSANLFVNTIHARLNNAWKIVINAVTCFAILEENIRILVRTTHMWMLRIKRMITKTLKRTEIIHTFKLIKVPHRYFLNLMRCSKSVKEIDERNTALNCSHMCNG